MAGFIVDVLLHGILEEVASLVIILRLWRFFKIIEEFSVGAEEQMDGLELRIEQLESENADLREELKKQKGYVMISVKYCLSGCQGLEDLLKVYNVSNRAAD